MKKSDIKTGMRLQTKVLLPHEKTSRGTRKVELRNVVVLGQGRIANPHTGSRWVYVVQFKDPLSPEGTGIALVSAQSLSLRPGETLDQALPDWVLGHWTSTST